MSKLLDVRGVSVWFATEAGPVYAVDDVSFELASSEVLAVVGESGSGKTMLGLSILALVPSPGLMTGRILLEEVDLPSLAVAKLRRIRGKDIGMVFQEPMTSLNPVFTVGRQIQEALARHEGLSPKAARKRTVELLGEVGIPAPVRRVDEYPHQLSGGMAQRVMIAMAIACGPKLLIADEPTTSLDVTIQAAILRLLLRLREQMGMAIMLITHDLGVVAEAADRVMVMYAGRKVEEATVDDLFARPQHPYTMGLLGAVRHPGWMPRPGERRRLHEIPGTVPVRLAPADHCVFATRCPRADQRCRAELPALQAAVARHVVACFYPGEQASPERRAAGWPSQ